MLNQDFSRTMIIQQIKQGISAKDALKNLTGVSCEEIFTTDDPPEGYIWEFLIQLARKNRMQKIEKARAPISDLGKVCELIDKAQKIIVIIGAGASIGPDFRSPGGLYDTIAKEAHLEDPYQVFDLDFFKYDPSVFWQYAHMIFPAENPEHSDTHYFIQMLEEKGKLLRLYSQNVDTLECGVPPEKLRCVHGSWRSTHCMQCGRIFDIEEIRPYVERKSIPVCSCGGQIKPGIVFFGQKTNIEEDEVQIDADSGDLLIVVGTSLRVAPISMLPNVMATIPSILINREPVTCGFSVELLGDCSQVVNYLEDRLGWKKSEREEDVVFHEPNRFFFRDKDGSIPTIYETGCMSFLVTENKPNEEDLL